MRFWTACLLSMAICLPLWAGILALSSLLFGWPL